MDLIPVTLPDGRVVNMLPDEGGMLSNVPAPEAPAAPADQAGGGGGFWDTLDRAFQQPPSIGVVGAPAAAGATFNTRPAVRGGVEPPVTSADMQRPIAPQAAAKPSERQGARAETTQIPDPQPQAPAQRARVIEGGPQKMTWQVRPGAEISGERLDAIEGSFDESIERLRQNQESVAGARQEAEQAATLQRFKQQDMIDAQRARRVAIDHDIQDLAQQRDAAQAEAEAAAVDPKRLIGEKPWVALVAAIGMALQGAAQREVEIRTGATPQPIATRNVLSDAIQTDIRNQQIEYEQAQDKAALAENRYGKALQMYGTPEDAAKALEAQDLQLAQSWLESKRQGISDQQQAATFDAVISDLEREKQMTLMQLEDAAAAKVTENWANTPDRVVGGAAGGKGKPDATTVRTAQGRIAQLQSVSANLKKITQLEKEGRYAEAEALGRATIAPYSQATGSGQPQGAEAANFLEEVFGDPGSRVKRHIPGTAASTGEKRRQTAIEGLEAEIAKQQELLQIADPNAVSTTSRGVPGER